MSRAGRRPYAADYCPHVRKPLISGHRHQAVGSHVLLDIGGCVYVPCVLCKQALLCKLCNLCKVQHVPRAGA